MSLKSELTAELKRRKLSLKDLNSKANKQNKNEILHILTRSGLIDGKSQTKLSKELREIGFKINNTAFRTAYNSYPTSFTKRVNPSKQRRNSKPKAENVPDLRGKGAAKYLYIAKVYSVNNAKRKKKDFKKIPKTGVMINQYSKFGQYNQISEIGLWSDKLMTRDEVDAAFLTEFWGGDNIFNSELTGSDFNHVLTSVDIHTVAFKYERVLKSD